MLGEGLPCVRHVKTARSPSFKVRLWVRVLTVSSVLSGVSVTKIIRIQAISPEKLYYKILPIATLIVSEQREREREREREIQNTGTLAFIHTHECTRADKHVHARTHHSQKSNLNKTKQNTHTAPKL